MRHRRASPKVSTAHSEYPPTLRPSRARVSRAPPLPRRCVSATRPLLSTPWHTRSAAPRRLSTAPPHGCKDSHLSPPHSLSSDPRTAPCSKVASKVSSSMPAHTTATPLPRPPTSETMVISLLSLILHPLSSQGIAPCRSCPSHPDSTRAGSTRATTSPYLPQANKAEWCSPCTDNPSYRVPSTDTTASQYTYYHR